MSTMLAIASGGALGAVLRHLFGIMSIKLIGHGFPFATLGAECLGIVCHGGFSGLFSACLDATP